MYTPGMLTDVVREVKEAARVREDALLSRVRAIVDERSWSTDVNLKLCRDLEEMKVDVAMGSFREKKPPKTLWFYFQIQFNVMRAERNETNARLSKMDDEIKSLRSVLSHVLNNGTRQNVPFYPMNSTSFNERDFSHSSVRSGERHSRRYIDNAAMPNENEILSPMNPLPHENRSSDKMQYVPGYLENLHLNGHVNGGGVYSTPENEANDSDIMQMEKETLKLRKELQDVMDSKQKADSKIIE